ncbi:GlcG/HbpS family heme-binding protein [Paraburkholderia sacchari]|uniref:GlcG/HbpS family heme-binding protein n=1 Tax=Paraburkholderia sacchari TaxID=159450 RepID=UPI003D98404C
MSKKITHEAALRAIKAGVAKAQELAQCSSLSIVDAGGHLVASVRVNDAAFGTIEIAHNKAYTAAALRFPTDHWMKVVQPGAELYGLERSASSRPFVVFGGGLPVKDGDDVIGGVGVSGGPEDADVAIASAMIASLSVE